MCSGEWAKLSVMGRLVSFCYRVQLVSGFPIPDTSFIRIFSWEYFIYILIVITQKIERWYIYDMGTKYTGWYVEIKCQLDATEVFIADLIACSTCFGHRYAHHQELKSIMQWLLPVVFRAVVFNLLVWCGAEITQAATTV